MATRPDPAAALSAKQAKSPEVVKLFEQLASRADTYARMQDEFLEVIIRHREARTSKPVRQTKSQQRTLDTFERDADLAVLDVERGITKMSDTTLLTVALSSEYQQLRLDEGLALTYHTEDRQMAQQMIEFRRETIRLIESFVESSPFKGRVVLI